MLQPLATPDSAGPSAHRAPVVLPPVLSLAELRAGQSKETVWLWDGYLATGNITLLAGRWKSGTTTLLSILLSRLQNGGTLLGQRLAPGRDVVVCEEGPEHWVRCGERLDFGDNIGWLCRPFLSRPTPEQWLALVDQLVERCTGSEPMLVAIDPLVAFLPATRIEDGWVLDFMNSLRRLSRRGASVLVLHQPGVGEIPRGRAARAVRALTGAADILIELKVPAPHNWSDRRRRVHGFSHNERTPALRIIGLNAAGTDYLVLPSTPGDEDPFTQSWPDLRQVLAAAGRKLTRKEIMLRWPTGSKLPNEKTLCRWLDWATAQGVVRREGAGKKGEPYGYWVGGNAPAGGV